MALNEIRIVGARQHNLKNLTLSLPRNSLVVVTGVSGSGKSSLAFDTLYAEGQRRYVESLSTYARQFLDQMEKPDVDAIHGLSPAIAIEQRTVSGSPRSTIATTTEIYDFARLLFSHTGIPHHPQTGKPLVRYSVQKIVDKILEIPSGSAVYILAPMVKNEKGEFRDVLERIRREGYVRVRVDGVVHEIDDLGGLAKNKEHTIEVVVDRLKITDNVRSRLSDSVELALRVGKQVILVLQEVEGKKKEWAASTENFDPESGFHFGKLTARSFSFNSPAGACSQCHGLGVEPSFDEKLVVADEENRLNEMPIIPWRRSNKGIAAIYRNILIRIAERYQQPMDRKWRLCSQEFKKAMLWGEEKEVAGKKRKGDRFEGVIPQLRKLYGKTESKASQRRLSSLMTRQPCSQCSGARLKPEILSVRIFVKGYSAMNIHEFGALSIEEALEWVDKIVLEKKNAQVGKDILRELKSRLNFLNEVGLGYLSLNRESGSLSGGEAQRIRLASQIGSKLTGILYILDEPSIGLHQRDNDRLLKVLAQLRDLGNTVIVVEHDEDTIRKADYIVELGPHAGRMGGELVVAGKPKEIIACKKSLTGKFLTGEEVIAVPSQRSKPTAGWLKVIGAKENNLKNIQADFPLGLLTCVTGVSGSGKSTLVNDVLFRALSRHFYGGRERPGLHDRIEGIEEVDKVVGVNQKPIGRTPRSNPLTYIGAYNGVRDLFSQMPASRVRGYKAGRFSFNVKGGRCEHCEGDGVIKVEMSFLPPVYVTCETCGGRRFNRETLEINYKGLNIADVLELTVEEGLGFFRNIGSVKDKLDALKEVGLGYLKLGQQATTLSGGEAQRVKLASELSKKSTGRTVYILDEPTTGLHFADVQLLLDVLMRLRSSGNTLIVIEHNLHVIKSAVYIIDLGPVGGGAGGEIVAKGSPEEVALVKKNFTGNFLRKVLKR